METYYCNLISLHLRGYSSLQIWKNGKKLFLYFQSLYIQEYAFKRIFQNFSYFMSYSYFCDATSALVRPEQMNDRR